MRKGIVIIYITIAFLLTSIFVGCTEQDVIDDIYNEQNQLPIPIITKGEYVPWWNDTIIFSAVDSYDPDGNITDHVWWIDDGQGFAQSKVSGGTFKLPDRDFTSYENGTITLAVIDNNGTIQFAYDEFRIINRPLIILKQIDSTPVIEITYIDRHTDWNLSPKELAVEGWGLGDFLQTGGLYGYIDVDEDGFVSKGDTIDITEIFAGDDISNSTVKINLIGTYPHNKETIIAHIEATIE